MGRIKGLFKREEGASAVEYAILIALIAAVIISAVTFLGGSVSNTFPPVANALNNAS